MRRLLLVCFLATCTSYRVYAAGASCEHKLSLCVAVVKAEDKQADDLRQSVKDLEGRLAKAQTGILQTVPVGVWVGLGAIVGVVVGRGLSK